MAKDTVEIKKIADLENIFGKKLAAAIIKECRGEDMMAKPRRVGFYSEKPAYYLNDGDVLDFYAVNIEAQTIVGHHFAGSADSAINHPEQFTMGQKVTGDAVLAVVSYWNGRNTSWTIDVISSNYVKQLA